ncbi:MAG: type II toxin-antitoxin system RelE/ParE family toxin [Rhodoglobus sp.]
MLRRRERAEAVTELDAAIDWYAEKRRLLAVEFIDAIEAGIERILAWPVSGRPYPGREDHMPVLRTQRVRGFPYRIVYLVDGDDLVIFAYPHDKQRPGYWKPRVEG